MKGQQYCCRDIDSGSVCLIYLPNTAILNMKRHVSKTRHVSVNYWTSLNDRSIVFLSGY